MHNRDDKFTSQTPTDFQIGYYDIYQYAQPNLSTRTKVKDSIESATLEFAEKNVTIIESYARVYCRSDNNAVHRIAFEAREWGVYYAVEGICFAGEMCSTMSDSTLGLFGGLLLGAFVAPIIGGVGGCIAGGTHALYNECKWLLLNEEQKEKVFELKKIATNRVTLFHNLNSLSSNTKQILNNQRFNTENELVSIRVVQP